MGKVMDRSYCSNFGFYGSDLYDGVVVLLL